MTASSKGCPGQTKAASGCPGGVMSAFSNAMLFIPRQDRPADTDQAVAGAHRCRDVGDLVATGFPLPDRPAEPLKRVLKERFDVMRLETARLGTRHVLANPLDPAAGPSHRGRGRGPPAGSAGGRGRGRDRARSSTAPAPPVGRHSGSRRSAGRAGPAPRTAACRARRTPARRVPAEPRQACPTACGRRRPRACPPRPSSRGGTPPSGRCGGCARSVAQGGSGSTAGRSSPSGEPAAD